MRTSIVVFRLLSLSLLLGQLIMCQSKERGRDQHPICPTNVVNNVNYQAVFFFGLW